MAPSFRHFQSYIHPTHSLSPFRFFALVCSTSSQRRIVRIAFTPSQSLAYNVYYSTAQHASHSLGCFFPVLFPEICFLSTVLGLALTASPPSNRTRPTPKATTHPIVPRPTTTATTIVPFVIYPPQNASRFAICPLAPPQPKPKGSLAAESSTGSARRRRHSLVVRDSKAARSSCTHAPLASVQILLKLVRQPNFLSSLPSTSGATGGCHLSGFAVHSVLLSSLSLMCCVGSS